MNDKKAFIFRVNQGFSGEEGDEKIVSPWPQQLSKLSPYVNKHSAVNTSCDLIKHDQDSFFPHS